MDCCKVYYTRVVVAVFWLMLLLYSCFSNAAAANFDQRSLFVKIDFLTRGYEKTR